MADAPSCWLDKGARLPEASKKGAASGWFAEGFTANEYHCHRIKTVLQSVRTAYQECVLADTYSYGRCLILDGEMQSAQHDEFIYHECLTQPAMAANGTPADILIMGGGEGATAREALRWRSTRRVVMADLDGEVLNFARKYLGTWHRGAFDDPRLRLLVEDARKFVERTSLRFDVVLSDLPSAIRGGPAYKLYTREFFVTLKSKLARRGVFAMQAGSGQLLQLSFHKALIKTLQSVFKVVRPYYVYIPAFDVPWGFCLCTDDPAKDPLRIHGSAVDARLRAQGVRGLKFLDGEAFEGLFRVPRYWRDAVAAERRVIREDRPAFFFE